MALKVRKGDMVSVTHGKDRGRQGRVQRLLPKDNRVVVEGVNMIRRHARRRPDVRQTGIVSMEAPLPVTNVQLVCPRCNRPARVGFTFLEDGRKVRVCKKCHETIE
ncbi:MAG: 50S ribosomal protein L24 [Chloroflexi bacterium]|nr:50S ribosomal protein L24 [Chloroflexota bacterium]